MKSFQDFFAIQLDLVDPDLTHLNIRILALLLMEKPLINSLV